MNSALNLKSYYRKLMLKGLAVTLCTLVLLLAGWNRYWHTVAGPAELTSSGRWCIPAPRASGTCFEVSTPLAAKLKSGVCVRIRYVVLPEDPTTGEAGKKATSLRSCGFWQSII